MWLNLSFVCVCVCYALILLMHAHNSSDTTLHGICNEAHSIANGGPGCSLVPGHFLCLQASATLNRKMSSKLVHVNGCHQLRDMHITCNALGHW